MSLFVLNSEITIGSFSFKGVHDIKINRSIRSYMDSAIIKIPSLCRVVKGNSKQVTTFTTSDLFNDRDPVTIKLGYNGDLREEFRGFVKSRNLGFPLSIECEGYCQQLRLDVKYSSGNSEHPITTTVKELLLNATSTTPDIKVMCNVDMKLKNFYCVNANGYKICDFIRQATDSNLSMFFIQPDVLWCGLVYTPYATGNDVFNEQIVNYRMGFNVLPDNSLTIKSLSNPTNVKYTVKTPEGNLLFAHGKNTVAQNTKDKTLNNVTQQDLLKILAQS